MLTVQNYLPQPLLDLAQWACGTDTQPMIDQAMPEWFIRHHRDAQLLCERAEAARVPRPPSALNEGRRIVLMGPPGPPHDRAQLALRFKADRVGLVVDLAVHRNDRSLATHDLSLDGKFRRDEDVRVEVQGWLTPQADLPKDLDVSRLHLDLHSRSPRHADFSQTVMDVDFLQVTAFPGNGAWSPQVALEVARRCADFRARALEQAADIRTDGLAVLAFQGAPQPQMLADAERLHARWMDGSLPPLTEASMEEVLLDILREYPETAPPPPIATERAVALLALAEELLKLPPPRRNQTP